MLWDAILYKKYGLNVPIAERAPEWLIDKLYEIDLRSTSVGNLAGYRGFVLQK